MNPRDFATLELYVAAWHKKHKEDFPDWRKDEMYMNGQFDEQPYADWEEAHPDEFPQAD